MHFFVAIAKRFAIVRVSPVTSQLTNIMNNNSTAKFTRGQQVKIEGHIARITGQTTIGKKSGETFWAVEVAKTEINQWGKKAKIIGWGLAQWARESKIEA